MKKRTPLVLLILINVITHAQTALNFDPNAGFQEVDLPNITCPTEFTFEAWINIRDLEAGFQTVLEFGDDQPFIGLNDTKFTLYQAVESNTSIPLNEWTHVAVTFSTINQEAKAYINGVLDATSTDVSNLDIDGIGAGIGYNDGDEVLDGSIDEVRIWSRVLSEAEIDANKNECLTGNETGLYAYYNFNEGTGITVNDLGPNNFDGIMINMDAATDWVPFVSCGPGAHFVTTWNTSATLGSDITTITIPTNGGGYNYDVDWDNDGTFDQFGITGDIIHDFGTPGIYTIRIKGDFPQIYFNGQGTNPLKLVSVDQWGINQWRSMESAFEGCVNAEFLATDIPDLSQVTSMFEMFANCSSAQFNPSIGQWDVSSVTNLSFVFDRAESFNQDISNWDVSNVEFAEGIFSNAFSFNQDISSWQLGNSMFMGEMFINASSFNQDIGSWDVSNVISMGNMFEGASSFDQNLGSWDIGNVTIMESMFTGTGLSSVNYDALLIGWSTDSSGIPGDGIDDVPSNLIFDGGNSQYCMSQTARNTLTDPSGLNWNITDGGFGCTGSEYYITTWNTAIPGQSGPTSITISTFSTETYNFDVDWTYDGVSFNAEDSNVSGDITHDYGTPGIYTVAIRGTFPRIINGGSGFDSAKLITIEQWGTNIWTSMESAFLFCANLTITNPNIDTPNLSQVESTKNMFNTCFDFNADIGNWDVSNITNMEGMFSGATSFNQPLNNWDVSGVTNMQFMFNSAHTFNQNISNWNVSKVTNMASMFNGATAFNDPLNNWDVSNVTNMFRMFRFARSFNQNLYAWDVSKVTNMADMFSNATSFDQNLGNWDISSLSEASEMFTNIALSTANYDALLISWSTDSSGMDGDGIDDVPSNITFSGGNSQYCLGEPARNTLTNPSGLNWNITDSGLACTGDEYYITTWKTDNSGQSGSTSITISTASTDTYNFEVDWTYDGVTFNAEDTNVTGDITHDYGVAGTYTVAIRGQYPRIVFNGTDTEKILTVEQWGTTVWTSMESAFFECVNLNITNPTIDTPDLSNAGTTDAMFSRCTNFNADIGNWDVSGITNMARMFREASAFNQDLNTWDVSQVRNMSSMFERATAFNSNIESWNTEQVENIEQMFRNANAFNRNIGNWNIGNVISMRGMFEDAITFNQDISNWDLSNVESIQNMFRNATAFNQNINSWNVSNVVNMNGVFSGATAFNQPLNNWNVIMVESMVGMFRDATAFNQDISNWDVSSVTNMRDMFNGATAFNQPIGNWNVSGVEIMSGMFEQSNFNQDIGNWNLSRASNMSSMFENNTSFNQDISSWDFPNIFILRRMFFGATAFDQNLGTWDIGTLSLSLGLNEMFEGVTLSTPNYDALLIGWSTDSSGVPNDDIDDVPRGLNFSGGNSQYCLGETARNTLTDPTGSNWTITDGGLNCGVSLNATVFLQGAALNPNTGEENLMRDDLRVAGLIPTTSTYGDGLTCDASVFNTTGDDAIVDWVWVELRDANDNTTVRYSRSALLQRDGDVVNTNGNGSLTFAASADDYYVVINHRNHLGIMTANPISLNSTATNIDFTDASNPITFGTNAQTTFGMPTDTLGMWSGNVNGNNTVIYLGGSNDSNGIKDAVLNDAGNTTSSNLFTFFGYNNGDVDMDGVIQYQGSGNDSNVVKDIILSHPDNQSSPSNLFIITEQLPELNTLRQANRMFNLSLIKN